MATSGQPNPSTVPRCKAVKISDDLMLIVEAPSARNSGL